MFQKINILFHRTDGTLKTPYNKHKFKQMRKKTACTEYKIMKFTVVTNSKYKIRQNEEAHTSANDVLGHCSLKTISNQRSATRFYMRLGCCLCF